MEELMEELPSIIITVDKSMNPTPREPRYEQEEPKGNNTNPIISDYLFLLFHLSIESNSTRRNEQQQQQKKQAPKISTRRIIETAIDTDYRITTSSHRGVELPQ